MARRESEFFGEKELVLVYMARRLKHALAIEAIFHEFGLDYFLETGHYESGLLFRTTRVGVFFYIAPEETARARELLVAHGYGDFEPPG